MSIMVFFWLLLSAALLYFVGWTYFILTRQKKAWKDFARQKKLRYTPGSPLGSAEVKGAYDGYTVHVFVGEHVSADARGSRKLSAIEVHLSSNMPFEAGFATGGMVKVIQGVGFKQEIKPAHAEWDKSYIAAGSSGQMLSAYLSPERMGALLSLAKIKNAWMTFLCRGQTSLLRIDTSDPLDSVEKLDKVIVRMIAAARALELRSGEEARLKSEEARKPTQDARIIVSDDDLIAADLQLEDEIGASPQEKPETE